MAMLVADPEAAAETNEPPKLSVQLDAALADPNRWSEVAGLLRALTRPLLREVLTMRQEGVEPFEKELHFWARQLSAQIPDDEVITRDPRYLLGRVDALVDLCDISIDQSLSSKVLQQAKRAHVSEILLHLMQRGPSISSELAAAIGISRTQLSNMLSWMETAELVRRVESGRQTVVSLGPKSEAAYAALAAEAGSADQRADQVESSDLRREVAQLGFSLAKQAMGLDVSGRGAGAPQDGAAPPTIVRGNLRQGSA